MWLLWPVGWRSGELWRLIWWRRRLVGGKEQLQWWMWLLFGGWIGVGLVGERGGELVRLACGDRRRVEVVLLWGWLVVLGSWAISVGRVGASGFHAGDCFGWYIRFS
ncbi:unnamed protein product [Rhodiola kirilowii]